MAFRHFFEGEVTLAFAGVPMQALPVVTQQVSERVGRRHADANTKETIGARGAGVDQIVSMAVCQNCCP